MCCTAVCTAAWSRALSGPGPGPGLRPVPVRNSAPYCCFPTQPPPLGRQRQRGPYTHRTVISLYRCAPPAPSLRYPPPESSNTWGFPRRARGIRSTLRWTCWASTLSDLCRQCSTAWGRSRTGNRSGYYNCFNHFIILLRDFDNLRRC